MSLDAQRMQLHDVAVRDGQAGYLDPQSGLFVLTAAYLASRNRCCGSGCRHCPYPADVQERAGRPRSRT
ncbi:MAG: hypothetical protein KC912_12940 [Proteobacteria bacterium]|nr:hypothetical protein [Pseudomonadota bacterium]